MAIPTKEEFLEALYARQEDAEQLVQSLRASGAVEQAREAQKLLVGLRKLITQAGGAPNA